MTYPDNSGTARTIQYNYDDADTTSPDYIMSRLYSIIDSDGTTLATYTYLGADQIVSEKYNEPQITLDYTLNSYSGLTRFGQVQYQEWMDTSSDLLDGYQYAYNVAGNITPPRT